MPFSSTGRAEPYSFNQPQSNTLIQRHAVDMTGFLYVTLVIYMDAPFSNEQSFSLRQGDAPGSWSPVQDTEGNAISIPAPGNKQIAVVELSNPVMRYLNVSAVQGNGGKGVMIALKTDAYNAPPLGSTPDLAMNLTTGVKL